MLKCKYYFLIAVLFLATNAFGQVSISIPDTTIDVGETAEVPVSISGLDGSVVEAFELEISFDASKVSVTGYNSTNSLTSGFNLVENATQGGKYLLSGGAATGFSEDGVVVYLQVEGVAGGSTDLAFEKMLLNEGSPSVSTSNGTIAVSDSSPPSNDVNISLPDTTIDVGETAEVPVITSGLDGSVVEAFELEISFDASMVSVTGFTKSNSLSSGFNLVENTTQSGKYLLSGAASTGFSEDGVIVYLQVEGIKAGSSEIILDKVIFNEGSPEVNSSGGIITVENEETGEPDLEANSVSGPASGSLGESLDIQIDLSNVGSANTGAFNVRVYLSANTTITSSDTEIGLLEINPGLTAGENLDTTKTFTIPASLSESDYYFGIRVDSDNSVTESDEDNNRVASLNSINISESSSGIPDLVANSINTSEEVSLNDSLGIDIEILNEGEATVNNFDIKIYLSTNTTITSSDELVGEYTISESISAGSGKTINKKKVLISSIDPGDYYVGVVIDPDDDIEEEDENNNTVISEQITVSEEKYIDLVAVGLQTLGTGSFSYQLTASNTGNIDASGNFQIEVFLSKNEEAYEKDTPIIIHKGNYTIETGSELELTLEATEDTTDIDPGEYFMWFAINLEGSKEENIEDNIFINIENTIIVTEIVSNEDPNLIPKEFTLSQNYPNPFNPTTQIQYQLPNASSVSFRVFDMAGREVYSFLNQRKPAGSHTISFDASTLSSGIYMYKLRAGEFTETKKMTLIK